MLEQADVWFVPMGRSIWAICWSTTTTTLLVAKSLYALNLQLFDGSNTTLALAVLLVGILDLVAVRVLLGPLALVLRRAVSRPDPVQRLVVQHERGLELRPRDERCGIA